MEQPETGRPMEGGYLQDALKKLAEICVIADSLRFDIGPVSEEDSAFGAEPLTLEQIGPELEKITRIAISLALEDIRATTDEWLAAHEAIA